MSSSSSSVPPLSHSTYKIPASRSSKLDQIEVEKIKVLALYLIGCLFVFSGLYLLLGQIGTIASMSTGSFLVLAGISSFVAMALAVRSFVRKIG